MSPATIRQLRDRAVAVLAAAGVPTPDVDAELLIGHVLGVTRGEVQAAVVTDRGIESEQADRVLELVERRAAREPLQHITGRAAFRSLELAVGPGVFVPRPETEFVAQIAIDAAFAVPSPAPHIVDLGTGSGAIAISVATEVPHAQVTAVEMSPEAFVWARQNVRESGADNLTLVCADLAVAVPQLDGTVDVVISNPPYIPLGAIPRDPEVRLYDPDLALYGGVDGLDVVRVLSIRAAALLRPGGLLILEHGELQGAEIRDLLAADGWLAAATTRDLLGRDRATTALRA
ncbi:MAG TPA: peptide chain release factor N(5)-glutamine methyltransferase [Pseudolysinimonas sp.]|nr:peptide chain release factor N(5)-glutamine methyltransferase [Pseudolysinimonas sp.]